MLKIYFPDNLRALRKSMGITQRRLAEALNVDQRTVSAWEKGICEPSFEILAKLCEIFGEDFNGILG